MTERPPRKPEGDLIHAAASRDGRSTRELARQADISEGRWRQIVAGYQSMGKGHYAEVVAPAVTLARMAATVGVTAGELESVGRLDAAAELAEIEGAGRRRATRTAVAVEHGPGVDDTAELIDRIRRISELLPPEEALEAIDRVLALQEQAVAQRRQEKPRRSA